MAKVDFKGLEKFAKKLEKLNRDQINQFNEAAIKELAARLLAKVIKRTPVGDDVTRTVGTGKFYKRGAKKGKEKTKIRVTKKGGTLRRGWTSKTQEEAESGRGKPNAQEILQAANALEVTKTGGGYTVEIINPVEYASYVEFGHTTPDRKDWVNGQFMLTISEAELKANAQGILERKLERFLAEAFQ